MAYYKNKEFSGITESVHIFDKFDASVQLKKAQGIYAIDSSFGASLSNGELSLNADASGSLSVFSLSLDGNLNFDTEKFKFSGGDFNADLSVEGFSISKEGPGRFNNGMKLFHNLDFNINLDLDQTYRDFRDLPVETPSQNSNLGPYILDND